jgi:WD40 repeat protein
VVVEFLPDGLSILSWDDAGIVRIWDVDSGRERHRLGQARRVDRFASSSETPLVATATGALTQVWDIAGQRKIADLRQEAAIYEVAGLHLSADGRRLATLSSRMQDGPDFSDATVRVWDVDQASERFRLSHEKAISSFDVAEGVARIATGGADRKARVWDSATGRELAHLPHDSAVERVSLSSNGSYLASVTHDTGNVIPVWDVSSHRTIAELPEPPSLSRLSFSPDNRWLAAGSYSTGEMVRLWNPQSAGSERLSIPHRNGPVDLALSPDGQRMFSLDRHRDGESEPDRVRALDPETGKKLFEITHDSIKSFALSADGARVVTCGFKPRKKDDETSRIRRRGFQQYGGVLNYGGHPSVMQIWDATTGQRLLPLEQECGVFSLNGRYLAILDDTTLKVRDVQTGSVRDLALDIYPNRLACSPDSKMLATAEGIWVHDRNKPLEKVRLGLTAARVWDLASGREILRLLHDKSVRDVRFSPDGQYLAAEMSPGIRIWKIPGGAMVVHLTSGRERESLDISGFSPDGRYLAATAERELILWKVGSWREVARLPCSCYTGESVFSPDGKYIAIKSGEQVSLWDWAARQELLRVPCGICTEIAFEPNGGLITAGWGDKALRVWSWKDEDLVADACRRLERNLTREEWRTYLGNEPYWRTCDALPMPQ